MNKISLIKSLNESNVRDNNKTTPIIEYQKYEIMVEGKSQLIKIPKREIAVFESDIANLKTPISNNDLRIILRNHRGIRG